MEEEKTPTLTTSTGDNTMSIVIESHPNDSRYSLSEGGIVQTRSSRMGTGGNNVPMVLCVDQGGGKSRANVYENQSPTLTATHAGEPVVAIEGNGMRGSHHGNGWNEKGVSYTLNTVEQHGVAYCIGNGQADQTRISEKVGALNCMHDQQAVMTEYLVRRLTPKECERLQGYPDDWTKEGVDGEISDTARYKALGNSLALPNALYIIAGIKKYG